MGIIRAAKNAAMGNFGDQYLEAVQPPKSFTESVVFAPGVRLGANDPRNQNKNGSENIVNNGSLIHVWPGTMMIIVDGGKIISACCEPGYVTVSDAAAPSLMAGEITGSLTDAFERLRFGGISPREQRVYYINMQEIRGIKYGTATPINYYDSMYDSEVFIRARGTYSFKITNPLKFFEQVIPKGAALDNKIIDFNDIKEQFNNEFLTALTDSLGKMSNDGIPFRKVQGNSSNLTKYLADALDYEWHEIRGMQILMTSLAASYTDDTQKIIQEASMLKMQGRALSDPNVQAGYMAKNVAEGIKAAGSNSAGATNAFLGMGMGMNMSGNIMQGYQQNIQPQQGFPQQGGYPQQGYPQQGGYQQNQPQGMAGVASAPAPDSWKCECGANNIGKFCPQCGKQKPEPKPQPTANGWVCSCGTQNSGKFCMECGSPMPVAPTKTKCSQCGYEPEDGASPKFCPNCGNRM
ncbi:MAG: SPFH domain-containing protein [Acutalibacteraceae bacterium]|nr:SPFH domain-containing protein [Acutalibacteraceae bacterium]